MFVKNNINLSLTFIFDSEKKSFAKQTSGFTFQMCLPFGILFFSTYKDLITIDTTVKKRINKEHFDLYKVYKRYCLLQNQRSFKSKCLQDSCHGHILI